MNISRALQLMARLAIERNDNDLFQLANSLFYQGMK